MKNFMINVTLVLISTILALLICEAVFRVWSGVPVFLALESPAADESRNPVGCGTSYDPELGWKPEPFRSGVNSGDGQVSILSTGIRSNGEQSPAGNSIVLAVGDSYTFGDQVSDDQSWPAALERRLNKPVLNGGVCGYGIGQSVRRAEILVEHFRPDVLILGMIPTDIDRTRASSFHGTKKPYFSIENGGLTYNNGHLSVPMVKPATKSEEKSLLRRIGVSLESTSVLWQMLPNIPQLIGQIQSRIALIRGTTYVYFTSDGVGLSCELLSRFRSIEKKHDARTLLVVQYKFRDILNRMELEAERSDRSHSPDTEIVAKTIELIACADKVGIEVVDTYAPLRNIYLNGGRAELLALYRGHMSPEGNEFVAELIAHALADM